MRRLAACIMAGLVVTGCKTLTVETDRPVDLYVRPYPTAEFRATVQGSDQRCTVRSSKPGVLNGKPGTCLLAGDDGVFAPCPN